MQYQGDGREDAFAQAETRFERLMRMLETRMPEKLTEKYVAQVVENVRTDLAALTTALCPMLRDSLLLQVEYACRSNDATSNAVAGAIHTALTTGLSCDGLVPSEYADWEVHDDRAAGVIDSYVKAGLVA
ncbi:hypothetical protein CKO28_02870 [Rhodovibrio sodomensis]|uniref:Uncharacterized protein n=1 Tax=Rhodovibrio sodomensis TaxID=1088 RepID=A0ABS1D9G7_9PROT|nr:hypothetical protein [Rhodovibrio sodomensis]